jgi:hypothetical protein
MDHIREMDKRLVIIPIPDNVLFPGGTLSLRLQGDQSDGVIDFLGEQERISRSASPSKASGRTMTWIWRTLVPWPEWNGSVVRATTGT